MFHFVLNVYGIREKKRFFAHSGLGCIAGDEQLQASRGQSLWMWMCVCVCLLCLGQLKFFQSVFAHVISGQVLSGHQSNHLQGRERERGREHQNDWCCSYLQRSLRKETTWNVCFRAANWYYFSVFQIISKTHWQNTGLLHKENGRKYWLMCAKLKKKKV